MGMDDPRLTKAVKEYITDFIEGEEFTLEDIKAAFIAGVMWADQRFESKP